MPAKHCHRSAASGARVVAIAKALLYCNLEDEARAALRIEMLVHGKSPSASRSYAQRCAAGPRSFVAGVFILSIV